MPGAADRESRLQAVLHAYVQALDAGQTPDHEEVCRQHPDLATELRAFFADQKQMDELAASWRTQSALPASPATIDSAECRDGSTALGVVRRFGDYELLEEI